VSKAQITTSAGRDLPEGSLEGSTIKREFQFKDFRDR
jgi:hypothetical protein